MKGLSIVATYYKGEQYIFNCIDAIRDSYERSAKKLAYEIVLVIDSMDDAEHARNILTERYGDGLRIFTNAKNIGVSESRNFGLKQIKYSFFTIMDQDDYIKPDYFSVLENELDERYAVHIINGVTRYVESGKEIPIFYFKPKFKFDSLILQNTIIYTPGLAIFNTAFVPNDNVFLDTFNKYRGCDDLAAYINIAITTNDKVAYKYINKVLYVYNLHAQNFSNNIEEMILSALSVIDNAAKKVGEGDARYPVAMKAYQRYQMLHEMYVNKRSHSWLLKNYPRAYSDHYVFSFFNTDRLNRLIFRLKKLVP